MASVVDICNMALSYCRAGKINSLNEGSLQADQCNLFYETCKDMCLEDAPWGFATKVESLALLDEDDFPVFNWVYAYKYPTDAIDYDRLLIDYEEVSSGQSQVASRLYDIGLPKPNTRRQVEHEVMVTNDTLVIASNDSNLRLKYRFAVTDTTKFDSSFTLALSRLIAAHISVPIMGFEKGEKVERNCLAVYQKMINNAIVKDLNRRHHDVVDPEQIEAMY
jgi:hypothetical protein